MVVFYCLYFLILIVDYKNLINQKDKNKLIIYTILTIITIIISILYYRNTLAESLVGMYAKIFDIEI